MLNLGQAAIFCVGLTSSLLVSLQRVAAGAMSVGDLVAVNSMLLQVRTYLALHLASYLEPFSKATSIQLQPWAVHSPYLTPSSHGPHSLPPQLSIPLTL